MIELNLKGLDDCKENWTDLDAINRVFCCRKTDLSGTALSWNMYNNIQYIQYNKILNVSQKLSKPRHSNTNMTTLAMS